MYSVLYPKNFSSQKIYAIIKVLLVVFWRAGKFYLAMVLAFRNERFWQNYDDDGKELMQIIEVVNSFSTILFVINL